MKDKLESAGSSDTWAHLKANDLDLIDDGLRNGSAGVKFVQNHDVFKPFALTNVAHAYTLMLPGNAAVYFNAKEFGDNRDFPKEGRGDALSVKNGSVLTKLLDARNSHGRGNYAERWLEDSQGLFAFEQLDPRLGVLAAAGTRGVPGHLRLGRIGGGSGIGRCGRGLLAGDRGALVHDLDVVELGPLGWRRVREMDGAVGVLPFVHFVGGLAGSRGDCCEQAEGDMDGFHWGLRGRAGVCAGNT
jgi:hypothetical protein